MAPEMTAAHRDEPTAARAVLGLAAVTVSAAIAPFLVGALAPRIGGEISLSTRDVGVAMAGYFLVSGALSPAGGRVVDRLGTTTALRWACALSTAGLLGIATARNTTTIVVIMTLLGVPNSVVQPGSNNLLARLERPRVRAMSFGVLQASIPVSTLIAALLLGLAGSGGGWRWTVVAVAVLTVLTQLVVPTVPHASRSTGATSSAAPTGTAGKLGHGGPGFLTLIVLTGFLASCAVTTLPSFAATTGHHAGLTPWTIAIAQTLGSMGSAVMRVVASTLASHAGMRSRLLVMAGLQVVGILGFLGLASGTTPGFVLGTIAAFTFGWGFNGLFNLILASARPLQIARATGITQAGVFLGGMTGPLVFAAIAGTEHFGAGWLAMSLFMAAAATTSLLAIRSGPVGRTAPRSVTAGPELIPATCHTTSAEGDPR